MSETNKIILELIKQNKTLKDISEIMNLSIKQVYQRIRQINEFGYQFYTRYHADGTIEFNPRRTIVDPNDFENSKKIYSYDTDQIFSALIISDLHLGNSNERLDLVKRIYEFCSQNDIHIILNAGDFLDGLFSRTERLHEDYLEQLYYVTNKFPYDDDILNFVLLGNHDASILEHKYLDVAKFLERQRHDIIPIGYSKGTVRIKNDSIALTHPMPHSRSYRYTTTPIDSPIVFKGHHHKMKVESQNEQVNCTLPSLSDLLFTEDELPGAVLLRTSFNKGLFDYATLTQLVYSDNKFRSINEIRLRVRSKSSIVNIYNNLPPEQKNRLILKKTRD